MYDIFLYHLMWIKCIYLSSEHFSRSFKYNYLHIQNPTAKNEYLSKYILNSTKQTNSTPLPTNTYQNFSTSFIICHHLRKWSVVTTHTPTNFRHTYLLRPRIIIQNNRYIHGTPLKDQQTSGNIHLWRQNGCNGVTCSRLGSVGVFRMW